MGRPAEGAQSVEADTKTWIGHTDWNGPAVLGWHFHLFLLHGGAQSSWLHSLHTSVDALPLPLPGQKMLFDIEGWFSQTQRTGAILLTLEGYQVREQDLSADVESLPGQRTGVYLLMLKSHPVREQRFVCLRWMVTKSENRGLSANAERFLGQRTGGCLLM